jgi:hypothetical protein
MYRSKTYKSRTKERTYDVNLATSQMISYDPLADEHLQDYFNSPHTRKHLVKLGLVGIQTIFHHTKLIESFL